MSRAVKTVKSRKVDKLRTENLPSSLIADVKQLVVSARQTAYSAVNMVMLNAYWKIGQRIVEEEQNGHHRASYGKRLIEALSEALTAEFGKGFSCEYLRNFRQFYLYFPDFQIRYTRVANSDGSPDSSIRSSRLANSDCSTDFQIRKSRFANSDYSPDSPIRQTCLANSNGSPDSPIRQSRLANSDSPPDFQIRKTCFPNSDGSPDSSIRSSRLANSDCSPDFQIRQSRLSHSDGSPDSPIRQTCLSISDYSADSKIRQSRFPNSDYSPDSQIRETRFPNLTWSHIHRLYCTFRKSRRDNTLLTVGFNLRQRNRHHQVPQGRHFAHQVSSLRDLVEGHPCRRLKPTVNKVLSLRDWGQCFDKYSNMCKGFALK